MTREDAATKPPPPPADSGGRWRTAGWLLAILALAATLRWHGLTTAGFSFDEIWHLEVANGHGSLFYELPFDRVVDVVNPVLPANARPTWQLPELTTGVTHPPGAFISLRLWRDLFGDGLFALRSWSAAWSLLAVALAFVAAARSFGTRAGLWASLLCAVSLGSIDQAREIRGYSMLQAVTLLTVLALLRLRRPGRTWPAAVALGAGAFLMVFTHYFSIGSCAAIGFGALLLLRGTARLQAIAALAAAGAVWIVYWLPHLREQLGFVQDTADVFLIDASADPTIATLLRAISAPYVSLVGDPRSLGLTVLAGGTIVWMLVAYRLHPRVAGERAALTWLWLALAAGALAPQFTLDLIRHTKHLAYPRYVVAAVPPLCVLLGSLPTLKGRLSLPLVAAVALAVVSALTTPTLKPDLRPPLAYLREHASPGDLILLPGRPERPRDAQARYLSLAYGLPWKGHRVALPVGPQPIEWINALPRDGRWFCLAFADYEPETWQPGLAVVDRGPTSTGVSVYEVRRADP